MACGVRIAEPGTQGGQLLGEEAQRAPQTSSAPVEAALAQLKSESTSTLTGWTLSFAAMGFRSPWRTFFVVLGVVVGLVGLGAGLSWLIERVVLGGGAVIVTDAASNGEQQPLTVALGPPVVGRLDHAAGLIAGGPVVSQRRSAVGGRQGRSVERGKGQDRGTISDRVSSTSGATASKAVDNTGARTGAEAPEPEAAAGDEAVTSQEGTASEASEASAETASSASALAAAEELPEREVAFDLYAGQVRRVIRQYYAARARSCFERALRNDHGLRGTVVVRFLIALDGTVRQASAVHNTTGDQDLGLCLAGQVESWRLPPPPGDEALELEMPFSS